MSKEKAIEKIHKSIDILKWYRVSKNEKNKAVCFFCVRHLNSWRI